MTRQDEDVRELRLEGTTLLLAGAALLALLTGAFVLGRWYERGESGSARALPADAEAAPGAVTPPAADVSADAGHFDRVGELELEPGREAQRSEEPVAAPKPEGQGSHPAPTSSPARPATTEAAGDGYFVQVFAGRDQRAAAKLVETLRAAGKPVRLDTERDGSDALYKVRVGAFASSEMAQEAALRLRDEGYPGAWVVRIR